MSTTVAVATDFRATHCLTLHGHPCAGRHTHPWILTATLTGTTSDTGTVIDPAALAKIQQWVWRELAGADLDELVDEEPTAENLAAAMLEVVHALLWAADPSSMRRATGLECSLNMGGHLTATVAYDTVDPFRAADTTDARSASMPAWWVSEP